MLLAAALLDARSFWPFSSGALPTLAALAVGLVPRPRPEEALAVAGGVAGASSSSALPSFSKRARALLNLVWWLSVRDTGRLARSSSFLASAADTEENRREGDVVGEGLSRLMRSGRLVAAAGAVLVEVEEVSCR